MTTRTTADRVRATAPGATVPGATATGATAPEAAAARREMTRVLETVVCELAAHPASRPFELARVAASCAHYVHDAQVVRAVMRACRHAARCDTIQRRRAGCPGASALVAAGRDLVLALRDIVRRHQSRLDATALRLLHTLDDDWFESSDEEEVLASGDWHRPPRAEK